MDFHVIRKPKKRRKEEKKLDFLLEINVNENDHNQLKIILQLITIILQYNEGGLHHLTFCFGCDLSPLGRWLFLDLFCLINRLLRGLRGSS